MKKTALEALRTTTPRWTPDCLEPDALLELAEEGQTGHDSPAMLHVAACAYCRPAYLQMRADLLEAEPLRAATDPRPSVVSGPMAAAQQPASESGRPALQPSWWERLFRPRVLVPAFGMTAALLVYLALGPLRQAQARYAIEQQRVAQLEKQLEAQRAQATELSRAQAAAQTGSSGMVSGLKAQLASREQELKRLQAQQIQEQARLQNQIAQLRQKVKAGQGNNGTDGSLPDRIGSYQVARVDPQDLELLRLSPAEARGGADEDIKPIELLSPVATLVADRRPWLRWRPVEGAAHYVVTLARDKGKMTLEEQTLAKGVTGWQPERALAPGTTFDWQVVATDATGKTLARSRARFATQQLGAALPHVATTLMELGRLYERAGLLEEAGQAYAAVPETDAHYKTAQERLRSLAARRSSPAVQP